MVKGGSIPTTGTNEMIEVQSSNIHSIGYLESEAKLFVKFKDYPKIYQYDCVPPVVWLGLKFSQSKGRYLKTQVIPYFRCKQLSASDPAPFKSKYRVQ
jgi:hypothetical protein